MNKFIFTNSSKKDFYKLETSEQNRIVQKLKIIKDHPEIFTVVKQLKDMYPITHRLRVGNYRLLLHLEKQNGKFCEFIITQIGHRRSIY